MSTSEVFGGHLILALGNSALLPKQAGEPSQLPQPAFTADQGPREGECLGWLTAHISSSQTLEPRAS